MRLLIDLAIAIAVAALVGFGSAVLVLDRDSLFGAISRGPWTAWPDSGSPDADPYSKAILARSGEVPLGAGEGIAFVADHDSAGDRLSGRCSYDVVGQTPPARLWTLTVYDGEGQLMRNPIGRTEFVSREILRREDGTFAITLAPDVVPGNWLPVDRDADLRLVLRLYDTPLTSSGVGDAVLPAIARGSCR